jgi:anti-repressor protein
MSANIVSYQFDSQNIRFVDGKPVANDVAAVLGYADPAKTVSTKVFSQNRSVTKMVTVDGKLRDVTVLEEAGIYQLIFSSRLDSAERFQQWVFSDVLPTIQKTGSYCVDQSAHKIPQTYAEALLEAGRLALENERLSAKIEQDAPLVAYAEAVQCSDSAIEFNDFAKMIGTGRTRLFRAMRECGVIMQHSNIPYQKWIDAGYFEVSQEITGNGKLIPFALVTGKGQLWLRDRIRKYESQQSAFANAICASIG